MKKHRRRCAEKTDLLFIQRIQEHHRLKLRKMYKSGTIKMLSATECMVWGVLLRYR